MNTISACTPSSIYKVPSLQNNKPAFKSCSKIDTFQSKPEQTIKEKTDAFAKELANLINKNECSKDNLKTLMRKYVPRTKLIHQRFFIGAASATYHTTRKFSNNNKIHNRQKTIKANLDKQYINEGMFFDEVTHEMIHNFQEWDSLKYYNRMFSKYFGKDKNKQKLFNKITETGMADAENLITSFCATPYSIPVSILRLDTRVNSFEIGKKTEKEKLLQKQVYLLSVSETLKREAEAYSLADDMTWKYFEERSFNNHYQAFSCRNLKKYVDFKTNNIERKLVDNGYI